jgi:hypothetical protein
LEDCVFMGICMNRTYPQIHTLGKGHGGDKEKIHVTGMDSSLKIASALELGRLSQVRVRCLPSFPIYPSFVATLKCSRNSYTSRCAVNILSLCLDPTLPGLPRS